MKPNYLIKSLYYGIRFIADEVDNALSLCNPAAFNEEYQTLCYKTAKSFKDKSKENFQLAFRKELSDKIKH